MGKRITYKRVWVIGIIFFISFGLFTVGSTKADWIFYNSSPFEYDVSAGSYQSIYFTSSSTGNLYLIEFVVTSGNDITFFLVDEENYWRFKADESITVVEYLEKVGSGSIEFKITSERVGITWYAVFSNEYSLFTGKHVKIDITRYQWHDPPALALLAEFNEWNVQLNDVARLDFTLANRGELTAEDVVVSVELPYGLSATQNTEQVGTLEGYGSSVSGSFFIYCNQPGTHTVTISVTASNTEDFSQMVTVYVVTPPELMVTTNLFPNSIDEDDTTTLTIGVSNEGEAPAEDVTVTLTLPSGLSCPSPVRQLYQVSSMTKEAIFTITGVYSGSYTISITVDAVNAIAAKTDVQLVVKEAPKTTSQTTIITTQVTTVTTSSPEPTTSTTPELITTSEREQDTVTVTQEGSGFIPGFGAISVLIGLPVLSWYRKRGR